MFRISDRMNLQLSDIELYDSSLAIPSKLGMASCISLLKVVKFKGGIVKASQNGLSQS
jgi:hypothetical protein